METEKQVVGYCRVSTPQQRLNRQIDNIKAAYPDAVIISETYYEQNIERTQDDIVLKNFNTYRTKISQYKPVIQYDTNNNIINTYDGITIAAKALHGTRQNIGRAIRSNSTAYGFYWKYLEE